MEYLFSFGRNPELSKAELEAYFNKEISGKKYAILNTNINPEKAITDLGGVVKIYEKTSPPYYHGTKTKLRVIITSSDNEKKKRLRNELREEGLKILLVNKNPDKEFLITKEGVWQAIAYSKQKEWKKRDLQKDTDRIKAISIRLAKIMINLSQTPAGGTILDPFCGTGVILQEASLMGFKVIGVDIDKDSIKTAQRRLSKYKNWKVIHGDSRKLSKLVRKVDSIITEPYLGPYLNRLPNEKQAIANMKKLNILYNVVFKEFEKVLKGRLVIILPYYKTKKGTIIEPEIITSLRLVNVFDYSEKWHRLGRKIYIFNSN